MKRFTVILFLTILSYAGFSQWSSLLVNPQARNRSAGFAIGDTGYVVAGGNSWYLTTGYAYDTKNNTWSSMTTFPSNMDDGVLGFTVGNKGYLCTGAYCCYSYGNEFYEYDPKGAPGGSWTALANFPGPVRTFAVGFVIGTKIYIGGGLNGTNNNPMNDFYCYDVSTSSWTTAGVIANCPASGVSLRAVGFAIGGKGYVGTGGKQVTAGTSTFAPTKDFWEYDPGTNTWAQKADFGGGVRWLGIGWATCDKGYMGTGAADQNQTTLTSDMWEYNPTTDKWTQVDNYGGGVRMCSISFYTHNTAYVTCGVTTGNALTADLWKYTPETSFKPTNAVNPASLCIGDSVAYEDTTNFVATNWQWNFPGGSPSTSTSSTPKIKYSTAGNYNVVLTAWNACDSGTTTFTNYVSVGAAPSITVTPTNPSICPGKSVTLKASGGTVYQWMGTSNTTDTIVASALNDTTYTLALSNGGCTKDTAIAVNITPPPVIKALASPDSICNGSSTILTANGGTIYTWSNGQTASSISVSPAADSTFTVTGTTAGCSAKDSAKVTVTQIPIPTVSAAQNICINNSIPLLAGGGTTYTWLPIAGLSSPSIANPIASPTNSTTYTVTVANGKCTATGNVSVTVNPLPAVSACCAATILTGDNTSLAVTPATAGNTYTWAPANTLSCNTCPNPVATPTATTWYHVTTTDNNKCSTIDSVLITVNETCGPVYMPNAFSPNGDGTNDMLNVSGNCIQTMDLVIYDRWGNKVFETTNPKTGWDGTFKGKAMNSGTYVFSLQYSDLSNNSATKKGNVTLVR